MQIIIKKYSLQKLSYAPNRLSIQFSYNDLFYNSNFPIL